MVIKYPNVNHQLAEDSREYDTSLTKACSRDMGKQIRGTCRLHLTGSIGDLEMEKLVQQVTFGCYEMADLSQDMGGLSPWCTN